MSELKTAHRKAKCSNAHAAYKINAIIFLGTGWMLTQVKQALLLDEETLRSCVKKYQEKGIEGLIQTHYPGRSSNLTEAQENQFREELDATIHLSTSSIIEYVAQTFGIDYTPSGMRDLLHRLGYEYKKPKYVPGNPDVDAQEIFVEQYEDFMEKKTEDIEVFFIDTSHPEHNVQPAYGWLKRGEKQVQEALKEHPKVRFVFLPCYSPNLNLIERLWSFFKKHVLHNQYHKDIRSFRRSCIDFFRNIDQHTEKIASLMGGEFDSCYS